MTFEGSKLLFFKIQNLIKMGNQNLKCRIPKTTCSHTNQYSRNTNSNLSFIGVPNIFLGTLAMFFNILYHASRRHLIFPIAPSIPSAKKKKKKCFCFLF
jgi:hypothetical protein